MAWAGLHHPQSKLISLVHVNSLRNGETAHIVLLSSFADLIVGPYSPTRERETHINHSPSACLRLFPSRDRLAAHRKRDHDTDDAYESVLTWNEDEAVQNETV